MRKKKNTKLELNEVDILTNFLPSISQPAHKNLLYCEIKLVKETIPMDKPC